MTGVSVSKVTELCLIQAPSSVASKKQNAPWTRFFGLKLCLSGQARRSIRPFSYDEELVPNHDQEWPQLATMIRSIVRRVNSPTALCYVSNPAQAHRVN